MKKKKVRVIIIDDERMITRMLKGFMVDYGFIVMTALSGAEGLDLISREQFDAAIVDMRLPDMDGNEVISRAFSMQPETAYFVHTGSLDYRLSQELRKLGLDEDSIIHKPVIDMREICTAIEKRVIA